jgi:tetratricopeptide (TPR) repeat protein
MKKYLLLAALAAALTACQGQTPTAALQQGQAALQQGDAAAAIKHLDEAIRQQPDLEQAWLLRSDAHYRRQEYAAALTDARRVLALHPQQFTAADYTALYNLGIIHNSRREFEPARRYLQQAKAKRPDDIRLYENLGYGYLEEGNPTSALAEFEVMARVDSLAKKAYYGLGKCHLLLKQFPAAIAAYDRAIRLDPTYAMAYQNRGAAKFELQDQAGGCQDWRKAIELGAKELEPYRQQFCP